MAQVKKFNTGGSVQKMKYGNIIKNGTTYEMTEESMKRLEQYIAAADPDIQQSLANDWKLLMSGQDVTIDTMANRRSTVPTDFSKGQLRRLGKDRATESKWHRAVNSDIHKYNLATQYLGKFDPSKSDKIEEIPQKDFWKSNKSIEYDVDDSGNKKYRGLSNTDEKNYFNEITAYLMGDDAFRAQYKDPGISNFETLDSWFKLLPNPEEFVKNLWNKIENGQELNSDESQFWNAIGMKFRDSKANPKYEEKVKGDEAQAAKEKAWEAFNIGNIWNDSEMNNDYFAYNPTTGTFTVKTPTLDGKSTGYYFNQDFLDSYYGYDHLKGKINFNGKWYNESDLSNPGSELYKMLNHGQYDYYNKNRRGDIDAVDAVLKTYWNNKMVPVNNPETVNYSGNFYQNSNYLYEPLNYNTKGTTYKGFAIPEDWSIFKRIDLTDKTADATGRRKVGYIMTDAYGNIVTSIDGLGPIKDALNYEDFIGLNGTPTKLKHVQTNDATKSDIIDQNELFQVYNNPKDNTVNVVFNKSLFGNKNEFTNMPIEVYNAISDNNFLELLNKNRNVRNMFIDLIQNKTYHPFWNSAKHMTAEEWSNFGLKNADQVLRYFWKFNNQNKVLDGAKFKQGGIIKANQGIPMKEINGELHDDIEPAIIIAEPKSTTPISKPSARFYLLTTKPSLPILPERKPYLEPKSSDFAEYKAINNREPDEVKNAREYISKLVDSDDYKKLSLTNPEIARTILSTQIESVLANTKNENVRNQISKELESFRQTSLFKEGGIIKAQDGVNEIRLPKGSRPTEEEIIRIASRGNVKSYSKGNIDGIDIISFNKPLSERKLERWLKRLPSGAYAYSIDEGDSTGSTPVTAQDPVTKTASVTGGVTPGTTTTSAGSTVTTPVTKTSSDESSGQDDQWGQHPSEPLEPWVVPTATSALMSTARLGFDRKTNDIITAQKAKGIREAADASMLSKQEFIPQRMQLTAGDASKAAANRMFQHLPPINSDYIKYAAQQRVGFDAANAMLAQSDREYSAQHSENLDKNIARQQMIADRNMQIEAQNKQIQAQKMAALSELYASRDAANRQSIANYMLEQQTKYEQGMQKAREARLAHDRSSWATTAKQMIVNALKDDPIISKEYNKYVAENPNSYLPIENWVASKPEFRDKVNEYTQNAHSWLADEQLASELQYLPPWYKSGGKMRSASDQIAINREKVNDQIKVNKYKSFDKNWEDQNKAVRKAIGKMHDRVYNILMKILS